MLTLLAASLVPAGTVAAGDLIGTVTGTVTGAVGAVLDVMPVLVPGPSQPASATTVIDGAKGGVAKCGRFSVVVPPGAWRGNAAVTIRVPDGTRLACDLSISPESANGFSRPVQLQMDAVGAVATGGLVIGWWDPALGRWTRVPGSVQDLLTLKLSAPLWHFSRYGGCEGKAGW
ncbi:MAG: hypothetical protein U0704_18460 [Candidatus Eisenbacteria bacterium]